jgi:ribonuclease P protein component
MAAAHGGGRRRGRRQRLSRSAEFDRVFREGRSHASRQLVVYAFPNAQAGEEPRLGVSVGRKVGGAVQRNRVKRLLREAFWSLSAELPGEHDFVVVARPDAASFATEGSEPTVEVALRELLEGAGLVGERSP